MKRIIILLLILFCATGCTRVKIVGANFPSLFSDQIGSFDIKYGEEPWQKLDVYRPANDNAKNPVVVFFYGGRWQYGSKNDYRFAADAFTERGYVVVIADYVKYPEGKYPQFVEDGAKAVAWTRENIWKYNGDIHNINVVGHSAGAYIGAMLSANEEFGVKEYIHAFVGMAGAYELRFEGDYKVEFDPIFNNPTDYSEICVPTYVSNKTPPSLLLWGEADKTINKKQMELLADGIEKAGGRVKTKTYPNIDHVGIVATFSQLRRDRAPVVEDIDEFFKSVR